MLPNVDPFVLPPPPAALLSEACLFIDFDGTLVDLVERPDAVVVDPPLHDLLGALGRIYEGRLTIISGRSIAQLDAMLGPLAATIGISGSHGLEHRWKDMAARPARPASLDAAAAGLRDFAVRHPGALIENKSFGVALHYRLIPAVEAEAQALARRLGERHGLAVQPGKMMVELRVTGGDKGGAVRRFMAQPGMADALPLCIGDDLTDESAFAAAAELGGSGILVGEMRQTAARYRLPDVASVRRWLGGALAAGERQGVEA